MTKRTSRPNIVLCVCDQLRPHEVGCYGHPLVRTPNLDRLAREGVRFANAVTNVPVCMAARSVLLSGQHNRTCTGGVLNVVYPGRPGDFNLPEYPERGRPHLKDPALPEILRGAGYRTDVIGKWHIHSWPDEVGFDHYLIPRVHHCHSGQSFTQDGGEEFVPPGYSVDFEAGRVEQYLEEQAARRGGPFFLYYAISPPHCPVADAPEKYLRMYDPASVPLRPNADPTRPFTHEDYWFRVYRWDFRYYNLKLPYTERLPEGYGLRELIAEYLGATTWMDAAVGRMLAALDRTGLAGNTLVVFTSDHGDSLGSLGLVQKGTPNEESIRVPLLWRWPGHVPAGRVEGRGVPSLVDIAPTLLRAAGLEPPGHIQGCDLGPVLAGRPGARAPAEAFVEYDDWLGLRTPDCTLTLGKKDGRLSSTPTHYWNLREDPYQMRNLAAEAASRGRTRELIEKLAAWDRRTPWMKTA
ncbi:MAG: sulfatase [Phycisphaerae bacterium]